MVARVFKQNIHYILVVARVFEQNLHYILVEAKVFKWNILFIQKSTNMLENIGFSWKACIHISELDNNGFRYKRHFTYNEKKPFVQIQ